MLCLIFSTFSFGLRKGAYDATLAELAAPVYNAKWPNFAELIERATLAILPAAC